MPRRGHSLLESLVVLALIARLLLVVPSPVTRAAPATPLLIGHATYVVQPGDTAWSIARSLHAAGDIRGVVDRPRRGVVPHLQCPRLGRVPAQVPLPLEDLEVGVHRRGRREADRLTDLSDGWRVAALAQ